VGLGYGRLHLGRAVCRAEGILQPFRNAADVVVLACVVSHSATCLKVRSSAFTEILARTCRTAVIIAVRLRDIVGNRPWLVHLEGETDQGHEQVDICRTVEVQRHPWRARHQADGSGCGEMVLESPDGGGREVQVNVPIGMEVSDLSVRRAEGSTNATTRLRRNEVGPGCQLHKCTRDQRHAPIMTSSPLSHQNERSL
jgi:hypothetical protein